MSNEKLTKCVFDEEAMSKMSLDEKFVYICKKDQEIRRSIMRTYMLNRIILALVGISVVTSAVILCKVWDVPWVSDTIRSIGELLVEWEDKVFSQVPEGGFPGGL